MLNKNTNDILVVKVYFSNKPKDSILKQNPVFLTLVKQEPEKLYAENNSTFKDPERIIFKGLEKLTTWVKQE